MSPEQEGVVILGHNYPSFTKEFMDSVRQIPWFTYRSQFKVPVGKSIYMSDAGWGCMIRTGQMIVGKALFDLQRSTPSEIIQAFLDNPSAPFSLHNIAVAGDAIGKDVGQWHTPSITARSLQYPIQRPCGRAVSYFVIFSSNLVNQNRSCGLQSIILQDLQMNPNEILQSLQQSACLIWLPMRLGLNELNPAYTNVVKALLNTPLAIGIGGGRPKSSYYFFGYVGTLLGMLENDLLYLDPHVTRPAILATKASDLTEEDIASYHGENVKRMPINAIDPCFVASYLLKDPNDFDTFAKFIESVRDSDGNKLISIKDSDSMEMEERIIKEIDDDFLEIS